MPRDGAARRLELDAALAAERARGLREDGAARRLQVEATLAVERARGLREDGASGRLEVEAALAAERAWGLREAAASLVGVYDMEVDSPRIHAPELDDEGCSLDSTSLNRVMLNGEDQYLEVHTANPLEDTNQRLNRLIAMQKRLSEANEDSLASQLRKRTRPASAANTSAAIHDIQTTSSPTPRLSEGNGDSLASQLRKRTRPASGVNTSATIHDIETASSPTPVSPVKKRMKRICSKKSLVWRHFSTGSNGEKPIAVCNHCGQQYACDRSTHGTSTLWNHLRSLCPLEPLKGQELNKKNPRTPKYSVEACRKALADMIIIDEMPFRSVEGEGFKRYSMVLQPKFELPSRITVARDCMQVYYDEKPRLKRMLKNQRICLTTDTWTSKQNLCYMSLTAHWIDSEWKLQKRILNFCSVPDHKGDTLGKRVEECLLEWGIDRLFTVTVDNASSNDRLIGYLKDVCRNWEGVVLHNKFLHVRCCAHIVNLVVKSGLEEHNESVERIRTAVKFVRSSPSRLLLFKKCAELEKIPSKSLLTLDMETRWNATFLMLESAEKFEKAFARLANEHRPFKAYFPDKVPPTTEDWETTRRILRFLKLFEKVTTRLSASLHVTSSIVFHDIMLMSARLIELAGGQDPTLSSMAYHMKIKFQKYWEEEGNLNYLLFVAVILDPRYKLGYLRYCLKILYGPDRGKEISDKIESTLDELFGYYAESVNASFSSSRSSNQAPIHINVDEDDEENPWDMLATQYEQHMEDTQSKPNDSELTKYLADDREKRTKEFQILDYWKRNSSRYPVLSLLAKDVLAVPASTVPSESAFSTGGRIVDPLRCSLSTSTVEALICSQSWLHSSQGKLSAREAAEEVQLYEDIREEFLSKDCTDNQHRVALDEFEA